MKVMSTGIAILDTIIGGGIPVYSTNIIAGSPGSGKTILVQQLMFNYIRQQKEAKVLYLTTLSEPSLKVVRYMQKFDFFAPEAFGKQVIYADIGGFLFDNPLLKLPQKIMELVDLHKPDIVTVDSFQAIDDLSKNRGEFRRLCYNLSVLLASARCTTFLVSESKREQIVNGAEFAIADGIFYLDISFTQQEVKRSLQVYKLRGQSPLMNAFPFRLSDRGISILSPSLSIKTKQFKPKDKNGLITTGINGLDPLLRGGIPRGRSLLLSGVSGTGKTTFALQFLAKGAELAEKGLLISFEESSDRLHQTANSFGWRFDELEQKGFLQIVFFPPTQIRVEEKLEEIIELVSQFQPDRLVIDSFSVFLYKIKDPAIQREKIIQLTNLIQQCGAVGLLISDIPANTPDSLSRFGVEETVVDGTILLSTTKSNLPLSNQRMSRIRYLEVYKMRGINHITGSHPFEIGARGINILSNVNTEMINNNNNGIVMDR